MMDLIIAIVLLIVIFIGFCLILPLLLVILMWLADNLFSPVWDWYMGKLEKIIEKR